MPPMPPPTHADSPYDRVPYTSYPYPQATPERLATIATLFGLKPAPPQRCRVLEIGCGLAGHLLPLAEQFPESSFLGIDASGRQIGIAEALRQRLGLSNIALEHQDIRDFSPAQRPFDYVLCHGVFSWVPAALQQRILSLCREMLAPQGVAFVSYNTFPGWHTRLIARELLAFRTRRLADPDEKLRDGIAALDLLADALPPEKLHTHILRQEREQLRGKPMPYVLHEYFETHNQPLYFHEFMARAAAHGLQFLGEAEFHTLFPLAGLANDPEPAIQAMAADILEVEQYRDFLRNRHFRQTLLAHRETRVDRYLPADRMAGIFVASSLKPDVADAPAEAPVTFSREALATTSADPLFKAAMLHLAKIYPRFERFEELYAIAAARIGRAPAPRPLSDDAARTLAGAFLRTYAGGAIELSVCAPRYTTAISQRPAAPRFARLVAADGEEIITNLRHESYKPQKFERHLLQLLDGTRDRAALAAAILRLAAAGTLHFSQNDQPLTTDEQLAPAIDAALAEYLPRLARRAFLLS
ncbi:MAG TPA: methyltransferase regulatory domain-containing protein [Phycisphaerae bacterium]|nr:methyltransferase regulatory domain-containing protein [Phycisphaerae bacterium]